jgi:protein-tyrosine-phosphatase
MRIVFLCVENANRSQLAEAFARMYAASGVEVYSAGSRPSGKVNPRAIEAMRELGYDMTGHRSKGLEALPPGAFDLAVTLCGDECPMLPARRRLAWQIPDPKDLGPEDYRSVRDLIGRMVHALLVEYGAAR